MLNPVSFFAPAKLNLYLHITGRRPDGYHDLDSLVAFAGVGDEIRLKENANGFVFVLTGPQAELLHKEPGDGNLAVKAAKSLAALVGKPLNVEITLVKNLPVASGIGGGSSDAAATLRALAQHWKLPADDARLFTAAREHGQDVPVCLKIENNYMTATGVAPAPELPHTDIVLVNPNKGLSTPAAYKAYREGGYEFSKIAQLTETPRDLAALVEALNARHNDFTPVALKLMPEIGDILTALKNTEDCLLSRMSGSGATCFGIYANRSAARKAASDLLTKHPGWWVAQSYLPYHANEF